VYIYTTDRGKVKGVRRQAMKAYRGEELQLQTILTLRVDGDECAASCTYLYPCLKRT